MQRLLTLILCLAVLCVATTATAAEPTLKALIIDGQNNHNWAQTTPVLKKWLEATELFTVEVLTSPKKGQDFSGFAPEFANYDVIVGNYTGDAWPESTQKALETYMNEGGGLVIVHAASNAFRNWPAWNEMIALGGWGGRNEQDGPYLYMDDDGKIIRDDSPGRGGGHGPNTSFTLDVREKDHPIVKGLPEKMMHKGDELYHGLRGPAKNVTILTTSFADPANRGTGHHEPTLMTITYGKGRVFHTVLGHHAPSMNSVAFIVTYQRGTEWAATGDVTQSLPEDLPDAETPVFRE